MNAVCAVKPPSNDFRIFLQSELIRRCKANPLYSLRAFARTLDIEPSFLSKILKGKRSVTESMLFHCASRLNLDSKDIFRFRNLNKVDSPKSKLGMNYQQLAYDHFQVISDWYHYAILELVTVKKFKPSTVWIARVLGISQAEAQAAVERLFKLGYLREAENKSWVNASGNNTTIGNKFTAIALKKMQKQILEKATIALDETPYDRRSQSAMTMAIDPSLLPKAKKRIVTFQRKLCKFLQNQGPKKEVYHMSISLYPVSQVTLKK